MNVSLIRDRMNTLGLKQVRVAKRVGIHPNTLSNFLNGKSELGSEKLAKLLDLLDLKFETLMKRVS